MVRRVQVLFMSTAATPQLCRVMEKADLDSFLKEAFGIQSNDFQAKRSHVLEWRTHIRTLN